jgi:hypothetical protein
MKVWALWSSRVNPYSAHELIDLFVLQEEAERVKAELIGKPSHQGLSGLLWGDDEDFPDLYVRPLDLR